MTEYWPCLLAAVCAIAVLRCAARQRHGMRSLLAVWARWPCWACWSR